MESFWTEPSRGSGDDEDSPQMSVSPESDSSFFSSIGKSSIVRITVIAMPWPSESFFVAVASWLLLALELRCCVGFAASMASNDLVSLLLKGSDALVELISLN